MAELHWSSRHISGTEKDFTVFGTAALDTREVLILAEKRSEHDFSKQRSHHYNYISVKHKMTI